MDELLKRFPQWAVVLVILIFGIGFFYFAMPPHTVCDSQLEIFTASETPFLYPDAKKKFQKTTGYAKSVENCKQGNSHGACRELFDGLRRMVLDLKVVPTECFSKMADQTEVKQAIWSSLGLFVELAWGDKAPKSAYEKLGWFDSFHLFTFCSLKRNGIEYYGDEKWTEFANAVLAKLPQANQLDRTEAWNRTLMSVNCDSYR